uniref:Testis-expressed protein 101-like n=1 Tax=Phascolarctos cinereus TaxID=38626 RepID=A0A6P5LMK3_PHACI|nr:testis-expressed protein 101-like [Phascolarctos cinereus]
MAPWYARLPLHLFFLGAALALTGALTCNQGILIRIGKTPTKFLANWTSLLEEECKEKDLCQDTILILETELQGIIIATKGCLFENVQEPTVVKYTQPPQHSPHQEGLMCPPCVSLGPCIPGSPVMHCPTLTLSCYSGTIMIKGGGIWTPVDLEGCMREIECQVLNKTHTIGPLEVTELCDRSSLFETFHVDCGSGVLPALVWALGLGSLLIL